MDDIRLKCQWDNCEETFESDDFAGFRTHVEDHLREILPGFRREGCDDEMPDDFVCPWSGCSWDAPTGTGEIIRHVLFHAFHTKLKVAGHKKQLELKLPACSLDTPTSNIIPDIPEPFVCDWEGCIESEFNCPLTFYQHVEGHASAADAEVSDQGFRLVACQWIGRMYFLLRLLHTKLGFLKPTVFSF